MKNMILTDVDGVLLDWWSSFAAWLSSKGYTQTVEGEYCTAKSFGISKELAESLEDEFNHSSQLERLLPLRDAVKYVRKLHQEKGFVLHCITAIPNTDQIMTWRTKNLEQVFGKEVIAEVVCTGSSAAKKQVLQPYSNTGTLWVEDKYDNAVMGAELGLTPYLIEHDYNKDYSIENTNITRAQNWKEIYTAVICK